MLICRKVHYITPFPASNLPGHWCQIPAKAFRIFGVTPRDTTGTRVGAEARTCAVAYFSSITTTAFAGTFRVSSESAMRYALNGLGLTAAGLSNVFITFIAGAV